MRSARTHAHRALRVPHARFCSAPSPSRGAAHRSLSRIAFLAAVAASLSPRCARAHACRAHCTRLPVPALHRCTTLRATAPRACTSSCAPALAHARYTLLHVRGTHAAALPHAPPAAARTMPPPFCCARHRTNTAQRFRALPPAMRQIQRMTCVEQYLNAAQRMFMACCDMQTTHLVRASSFQRRVCGVARAGRRSAQTYVLPRNRDGDAIAPTSSCRCYARLPCRCDATSSSRRLFACLSLRL